VLPRTNHRTPAHSSTGTGGTPTQLSVTTLLGTRHPLPATDLPRCVRSQSPVGVKREVQCFSHHSHGQWQGQGMIELNKCDWPPPVWDPGALVCHLYWHTSVRCRFTSRRQERNGDGTAPTSTPPPPTTIHPPPPTTARYPPAPFGTQQPSPCLKKARFVRNQRPVGGKREIAATLSQSTRNLQAHQSAHHFPRHTTLVLCLFGPRNPLQPPDLHQLVVPIRQ